MTTPREVFVGIDVAKLRNAVAVADAGRDGEIRYMGGAGSRSITAKDRVRHDQGFRSDARATQRAGRSILTSPATSAARPDWWSVPSGLEPARSWRPSVSSANGSNSKQPDQTARSSIVLRACPCQNVATSVDAPTGARRIFRETVARRLGADICPASVAAVMCRGPVWEFADQVQIRAACSKHFVANWLPDPVSRPFAPYPPPAPPYALDDPTITGEPMPPRPELCKFHPSTTTPRQSGRSCWPTPLTPASSACAPACALATTLPEHPSC